MHRSLDHVIGVRIPASQPIQIPSLQQLTDVQSSAATPSGPRVIGKASDIDNRLIFNHLLCQA